MVDADKMKLLVGMRFLIPTYRAFSEGRDQTAGWRWTQNGPILWNVPSPELVIDICTDQVILSNVAIISLLHINAGIGMCAPLIPLTGISRSPISENKP